ncbi:MULTISPECIES: Grx4 family monothiol glutaredoxin [Fischerella]|jgi:monothiol glutaredoxin|uniref:Glutaredoxin n=6 Tax=Fischerella TaxID=1190 RepID=G6FRM4_9CYAN|nr:MULTISPECIES: Grx4 family monothiol glutaredoxin [Fischerella]PLZ80721.1 glutaredoxin [Fischerella thermalis WC217]PLZ89714.1 glutaredoxin [Fischerella thermalis CCMEE 5196]PMB09120.1 glutaredoxin [Fischerella thermalis CCMEE 5273]PMB12964.1 glutaredoxin [Fischerella thermalis CCMEE 5328]PMB23567.1 glutaredoxin [Fischerella thermalis CCMEE 5319]PMB41310.1 glutaredoxin [Fischerella thermalis CCMEE 5205]PMB53145.1 glutaredoxin [Fischerella thermalis CCMEE 5201]RDH50424.1 glutaredoxin [Mast
MTPELKERIDNLLKENKILVFMKGTKLMPMCGFSNNVVQILNTLGVPFETVNILDDYELRQGIKEYSNWPTIPQVYINGEFVGGSDIMIELYQKGELQQMVEVALAS